jgi:hypothetical protein
MSKRFSKTRLFCIACILQGLIGCAQLGPVDKYWIKPGQSPLSGPAATLLLYFEYVRNLSASDYALELDHIRQLAATDKSAYRSLQYALALSLPNGDPRKAQQVIDSLPKENTQLDPELVALSNLIAADLSERRRLELDGSKRAEAEAKRADTEAKRADTEAKRAEAEIKKAEAETKRADEFEKKLQALKNIEKNLIERKKVHGDKQ